MLRNKNTIFFAFALLLLSCFSSCDDGKNGNNGNNGNNNNNNNHVVNSFKQLSPPFSEDSAFVYIEKQLAFGPRVPNTPAHDKCAEWIVAKFKEFGATVVEQKGEVTTHDGVKYAMNNIIASVNPNATKRVMVTAHWDSRPKADQDASNPGKPVPAANDGGSGVAVILELARQFSMKAPSVGVDFMLWDAEDSGNYNDNTSWCLGSQYWSKHPHSPTYRAAWGINLDMVGAANANFVKDGYSVQQAGIYTDNVWNIAHSLGYGAFFPLTEIDGASIDDHYFVMQNAGIPMVEIIDKDLSTGNFFPHWHTLQDDITAIDKKTLKAVGQTVAEVIYREK